jgi:hypothetical protein
VGILHSAGKSSLPQGLTTDEVCTPLHPTMLQAVRRRGELGDFNPLPLVAIIANTLAWLVYGMWSLDHP